MILSLLMWLLCFVLVFFVAQWILGLIGFPEKINNIVLAIIGLMGLIGLLDRVGWFSSGFTRF